jgi:hypothetical protein
MTKDISYSQFAQNYIEHWDNFRGLEAEMEELLADGLEVPENLKNELNRHKLIIGVFVQVGKEKFNKEHNEIYKDGWNFWIEEDAELREKRYGKK